MATAFLVVFSGAATGALLDEGAEIYDDIERGIYGDDDLLDTEAGLGDREDVGAGADRDYYLRDQYGAYDPRFSWWTDDEAFDTWYGDADEDWLDLER